MKCIKFFHWTPSNWNVFQVENMTFAEDYRDIFFEIAYEFLPAGVKCKTRHDRLQGMCVNFPFNTFYDEQVMAFSEFFLIYLF